MVLISSVALTSLCMNLYLYNSFSHIVSTNSDLGIKISNLMQDVYITHGEKKDIKYNDFISDSDYNRLNYRETDEKIVSESNIANLIDLKITDDRAIAKYSYIYNAYDKNGNVLYADGIIGEPIIQEIELEYEDREWKVKRIYDVF